MEENHNGHNGNGTSNSAWNELTLPDSGVSVRYRRVSHFLLSDAAQSVVPPTPPLVDVHYGDNVKAEPNPNAPEYLEAVRLYNIARNNKALETAIILGVQVEVDHERVKELRDALADSGISLPRNDKVLYVTRILCETKTDLELLRDTIIRKSQPTEGAIAEAIDTFRADVQGR